MDVLRGSATERRSPCTSTRSIAADGGASGSHNTSPFTRVVSIRGRPFFFARKRAQAKATQHKGGRTDDDGNDGNRNDDEDGGERAEGCCEAARAHHEGARGHDGREAGYLSQIANGRRPWTPKMREKVAAVLGEVPGQGIVYRQGGVVNGESSFIRERARTLGMTMRELSDRVGVSNSYMSMVARGHRNMGVKVQARVESALQAPAKVAPARCANHPASVVSGQSSYVRERARALGMTMRELAERVGVSASYMSEVSRGRRGMGVRVQALVEAALEAEATVASVQLACVDPKAVWDRMDAHGISQNEVARRAGISSSYLSHIMNGKSSPSAGVLKRLHAVLFRRAKSEERVMPAELKVLGWRKGERSGMVVHGAGGPGRSGRSGGPAVRVGGRVPWGARAEYAYRAGYDGAGRLSMTPVLMPGYSAMLKQPEMAAA